jgi:hypothetical protein
VVVERAEADPSAQRKPLLVELPLRRLNHRAPAAAACRFGRRANASARQELDAGRRADLRRRAEAMTARG